MLTWLPNSKKCLAVSFCLLGFTLAHAAQAPLSPQQVRVQLLSSLRTQAQVRKGQSFDSLLQAWETRYNTRAVDPLFSIARDRGVSDQERYMALMGAVKLGGRATGPKVETFLFDTSWMLRSGALRSLGALGAVQQSDAVLGLLKDPALVVRMEAVQAIEKLKPARAARALVSALRDPANYHHGKAQWIPQRALTALVSLKARNTAPDLAFLLDRKSDPELQKLTLKTLEFLTGQKLAKSQGFAAQLIAWKSFLNTK